MALFDLILGCHFDAALFPLQARFAVELLPLGALVAQSFFLELSGGFKLGASGAGGLARHGGSHEGRLREVLVWLRALALEKEEEEEEEEEEGAGAEDTGRDSAKAMWAHAQTQKLPAVKEGDTESQ